MVGKSKYLDRPTQYDTIIHKERQAPLRFLAFIALTAVSSPRYGPRCRWSLLSFRAQSIERTHNDECPPISSFRLNVVQVLPVQLERELSTALKPYHVHTVYTCILDVGLSIRQINDLEWLLWWKKVVFRRSSSPSRAHIAAQSLNCWKDWPKKTLSRAKNARVLLKTVYSKHNN